MKRTILSVIIGTAIVAAVGGCGLPAVLGTPSAYEQKVEAEYNLAEIDRKAKVLVLVEQPGWIQSSHNLRQSVSGALAEDITEKIKLSQRNLVPYEKLIEHRNAYGMGFSALDPAEVGRMLGADLVLAVTIDGYQMDAMADSGYYRGAMTTSSRIVEVDSGRQVWPESVYGAGKVVRVGFEVESRVTAVKRLAESTSHCIVRYLYDCPGPDFRSPDDLNRGSWDDWEF